MRMANCLITVAISLSMVSARAFDSNGDFLDRSLEGVNHAQMSSCSESLMATLGLQNSDLEAAKKAFREGKYDLAIALATKAIGSDPKLAGAYNTRACAYHMLQRYQEALPDFDKALELDPFDAVVFANRGRTCYSLRKYDAALKDFDKAVQLDPKADDHVRWRGHANGALGKVADSLADFHKAAQLDPKSAQNQAMVSRGFRIVGKLDEAVKAAEAALKLDPKYTDAFRERARAYIAMDRFPEAQADLDKILKANPKDEVAHYDLSRVLLGLGKQDEALNELNEAIKIDPNYLAAIRRRAEVLRDMGKVQDAQADEKKYELLSGAKFTPIPNPTKVPVPTGGPAFEGWMPNKPDDESLWKLPDTPWRKDEPPLKDTDFPEDSSKLDIDEYRAMARQALEMVAAIYGDMTDAEQMRLQAKWAPVLDFPFIEGYNYFRKLNPLLNRYLALRGALAMASAEFDSSWERAGLASTMSVEEEARLATQQAISIEKTMKALLDELTSVTDQIKALGDPPNPLRARKKAQKALDRALAKVKGPGSAPAVGEGVLGEWEGTYEMSPKGQPGGKAPIHLFFVRPPAKGGWAASVVVFTMYGPYFGHYSRFSYKALTLKDNGGGNFVANPNNDLTLSDQNIRINVSGSAMTINSTFTPSGEESIPVKYELTRVGEVLGPGPTGCTLADIAAYTKEANRLEKTKPPKSGDEMADMRAEMEQFDRANQLRNRVYSLNMYHATRYTLRLALAGFKNKSPGDWIEEIEKRVAEVAPQAAALYEKDKAAAAALEPKEESAPAAADSANKVRITEIRADIDYYKSNLEKWKAELAKAKDQVTAQQLQQNIVATITNIQEQEALVQSLETGTIVQPRTLWQQLAHQKLIDDAVVEAKKPIFFSRLEKQVDGLIGLLEGKEEDEMRALKAQLLDPTARATSDPTKMAQLMRAVHQKVLGQQLSKEVVAEEWINTCEEVKFGAGLALIVVTPYAAVSNAPLAGYAGWIGAGYGVGTGYIEGGPTGAVVSGLRMYSAVVDVAAAAIEGFQNSNGSWSAAAEAGILQLVLRKGLEMSSQRLVQERLRAPQRFATWEEAQLSVRYKQELEYGKAVAEQYRQASKEFNAMANKKAGGMNTEEYIKTNAAELSKTPEGKALLDAIGAVEGSYTAKLQMNGKGSSPEYCKLYNNQAEALIEKPVISETQRLMQEMGYGPFKMAQIRHGANKGKVGMDHDLAVAEDGWTPTRNGEPITMLEFQKDLNACLNKAFRKVTGNRSAEHSDWRGTTSVDPEAYLDRAVLEINKMREQGFSPGQILRAMNAQTADQTAGVNLYKVQKALMRSDAIGIAEACRTMTKELDTKILPTMDKGSMEYKLFVRLREVLAGGTNDPIGVQEKIRAATGRDLMETAQLIANKLGISIKGG